MSQKHETARLLRRKATKAEQRLWWALRDRRLKGFKFRRQHPIGHYYGDNVCLTAKLIVELDGDRHLRPEGVAHDTRRDAFLRNEGYRVLRFWNVELDGDGIDHVLKRICDALGVEY